MIEPSYAEFERQSARWPVVPVMREILADLETPVSAFLKLASGRYSALLESIEGGETWGRYSMIGLDPALVFESAGRRVRVIRQTGESEPREEAWEEDRPLRALDRILDRHRTASIPGLPRLAGGAVGYISYDAARLFERIPDRSRDDLELPDARFVLFEAMVLFDNQAHTVKIVVNGRHDGDPKGSFARAAARIDEITSALARPDAPLPPDPAGGPVHFSSSVTPEEYRGAVRRAKEYIRSGDVVQVVLSHRMEAEARMAPFDVYRALRVINPSPYLFYLHLDDLTLVGSSPEALVRREGTRVETRPIAGTRPRGDGEIADKLLEQELLSSEKERAEHLMLVDLGRNDLGRICRFGSVETTEFMKVERYSHVMHLVSHVRGELAEAPEGDPEGGAAGHAPAGNADILEACFPAGTVTGAPKIRAMEIIEELEPIRRGAYAGAIGYVDFHGNMDTCIAIRTLLFRGSRVYLGVGAGIVADSDPEEEYRETVRKGSALIRACELAQEGLGSFSRARARTAHPGDFEPRKEPA